MKQTGSLPNYYLFSLWVRYVFLSKFCHLELDFLEIKFLTILIK